MVSGNAKIKAVLWDIDGTVLNFGEAEKAAIRKGFKRYGMGECTDDMLREYSQINSDYWKKLERGEMTKKEILTGRFKEFFKMYDIDAALADEFNDTYQYDLGDTVCVNDNAIAVIDGIPGHILQYAVTNGTAVAQRRKIAKSGLDKRMKDVFISEEVGFEKPRVEYFEFVFQRIREDIPDIRKKEMIIIGDSLTSDIQLGNNAGILCCWYNPEKKENKTDLKIDFEIMHLSEVNHIVAG